MEREAEKLYPVLEELAKCLKKYKDFVSFNSVSTSWRGASSKEIFQGLCLVQETPQLMVSAKEEDVDREFYSLMEKKVVAKVSLPELRGKRCIESLGWFLTISPETDMISLMNPFTGLEIRLPSKRHFPSYGWVRTDEPLGFIQKMALSSRPCQTSNFVVMVLYGSSRSLGFWRTGEEKWTMIEMLSPMDEKYWLRDILGNASFQDLTYCNGQFFAIDSSGCVWACNLGAPNPYQAKLFTHIHYYENNAHYYIVGSLDKLIVLACREGDVNWAPWRRDYFVDYYYNNQPWGGVSLFELFEVDIGSRSWARINSLGGRSLFIGHSSSLLVNSSDALKIKANHIYYAGTPNWFHTAGGWVYSLEDRKLEPLERGNLMSPICPPIWVAPFF